MKFKATVPLDPEAQPLMDAFSSSSFRDTILKAVAGRWFDAQNAHLRPAEYMVQEPDRIIVGKDDNWGVHFTISGVSRANRTSGTFLRALAEAIDLCRQVIGKNLPPGRKCQLFVVMFLDGEIPGIEGGSTTYSQVLESKPEWVTANAA